MQVWLGTVLAFCAGAVTAGWAVGRFSTNGNAADWLAAFGAAVAAGGTCVIGYVANEYTNAQAARSRDNERARNASHIQHMRVWIGLLKRPAVNVTRFARGELVGVTVNLSGACGNVEGASGIISLVPWDDPAWGLISAEDVEARIDAMSKTYLVRTSCDSFLKWNADWDVAFDPEETPGFSALCGMLWALHDSANALAGAIDRAEQRLRLAGDLH